MPAEGDYDGIILDIMLPKKSGLEVLKELREGGCRAPVLLLTAKAEVEDRILGLDTGADDYLPKPFAMGELLARVRAMLRRAEAYTPDILSFGDLKLDRGSNRLSSASGAVTLTRLAIPHAGGAHAQSGHLPLNGGTAGQDLGI